MAHWLVKSEPDAFSWDQQVQNGTEPWTGVRNALAAIKADPDFAELALVRQSRLSVMPVSDAHWARLCKLGGWTRK